MPEPWLILSLLWLGCVVGFIAGLLGVGGGGIMVPLLTSLFLINGVSVENVVHLALGTSMASIIITSISSIRAHHAKNGVLWDVVINMAPGILSGAFMATFIASYLNSLYLAVFFSVYMAYAALRMFLNKKPEPDRTLPGRFGLFSVGSFIGAVSSLVSIGGGSLSVPYLSHHNVKMPNAIGTSAALGLPISVAGTIGYVINGWGKVSDDGLTFGYIYLPAVVLISSVSFFMAPLGVNFAHKLPVGRLKKIFAVLLVFLSIKMLASVLKNM